MFLRKAFIDQTRVNMLRDWEHSGFSVGNVVSTDFSRHG